MDLGIAGRTALVSGGSRGIGKATARLLLRSGAQVAIAARSEGALDAAVAELAEEAGAQAVCGLQADMTDPDEIREAVSEATARFERVDIAVSNVVGHTIRPAVAGDVPPGHFPDVSSKDFEVELRQLALSAWHLAAAVLPGMRERRWGRLVNVGSRVAREPRYEIPHVLPNVVRPVTHALHEVLAARVAAEGITVNSVLTGSIATERNRDYHEWLAEQRGTTYDAVVAQAMTIVPLRRMGAPEEIASVIGYLCSEHARGVTGQGIPVDGGVTRAIR